MTADSQDKVTANSKDATKSLSEVPSKPYELQPGGIYLFEVKEWALSKAIALQIADYYDTYHNIDIQFVFTGGNDFAIRPVSPQADDAVSDLQPSDQDTNTEQAEAKSPAP